MANDNKPYSKKMRNDLTAEYVSSILFYNQDSGHFTWKNRADIDPRGKRRTNKRAGFVHKGHGYEVIRINGVSYLAHRLAYLVITRKWPEYEIDHENRNRSDNRWKNLRPATATEQARNASYRKNSKYLKGVYQQRSGHWGARIRVDKWVLYLGTKETQKEAHELYREAAKKHFGEFACLD